MINAIKNLMFGLFKSSHKGEQRKEYNNRPFALQEQLRNAAEAKRQRKQQRNLKNAKTIY